jgi:hypothetical protein
MDWEKSKEKRKGQSMNKVTTVAIKWKGDCTKVGHQWGIRLKDDKGNVYRYCQWCHAVLKNDELVQAGES